MDFFLTNWYIRKYTRPFLLYQSDMGIEFLYYFDHNLFWVIPSKSTLFSFHNNNKIITTRGDWFYGGIKGAILDEMRV